MVIDSNSQHPEFTEFSSNEWPKILAFERISESSVKLHIQVDKDVHWFNGHFPGQPILPGVVQTSWASEFGCKLFAPEGANLSLENIKFSALLLPSTECDLSLDFDKKLNRIAFKYSSGDEIYSQGRIAFK